MQIVPRAALEHQVVMTKLRPLWLLLACLALGAGVLAGSLVLTDQVRFLFARSSAERYINTFQAVQEFYTREIFDRHSEGSANTDGTRGMVPAQFTIELGKYLQESRSDQALISMELYSAYPFKQRADRVLSDVQLEALKVLSQPDGPESFAKRVSLASGPGEALYFATPVRMTASACVDCHNTDANSPRQDWSLGDFRGVRAAIIPLEGVGPNLVEPTILWSLLPLGILVLGGVPILWSVFNVQRTTQKRLILAAYKQRRVAAEARQASRAAWVATRARDLFLARLSHELRNPLTSISGYCDLLLREERNATASPVDKSSDRRRKYVAGIQAASSHILLLINDILDSQSIEQGTLEVTRARRSLGEIMSEVQGIMEASSLIYRKPVRMRFTPAELNVDARLLKQILINLISNGLKYSDASGVVDVRVDPMDLGGLRLTVSDNGFGMSPEELERALQPFMRVRGAAEASEGTGLGLPLVKAMAEVMGGRFAIRSGKDAGTTVTIELPDVVVPGTVLQEPSGAPTSDQPPSSEQSADVSIRDT